DHVEQRGRWVDILHALVAEAPGDGRPRSGNSVRWRGRLLISKRFRPDDVDVLFVRRKARLVRRLVAGAQRLVRGHKLEVEEAVAIVRWGADREALGSQ